MPVFHTKTIESILEPVAQQVSKLVILHEEADDGNEMPDLSFPVQVVKKAADNLIKVGYETCETSEDKVMQKEMKPALKRVEEACNALQQAALILKDDPKSTSGKRNLIIGERGILQGVSTILLRFDESEVRKIIRVCNQVVEYLQITEIIEKMDDLVMYVKNLTPILTKMTREIDIREKELTHQIHRNFLCQHLDQIKSLTPSFISSIKISLLIGSNASARVRSSVEMNKNYLISRLSEEISEMIRILQLTTYDEDEWMTDDLTVMRQKLNSFEIKLRAAFDWLDDRHRVRGGVGEKAMRNALYDSIAFADRLDDENRGIQKNSMFIKNHLEHLCVSIDENNQHLPHAMKTVQTITNGLHNLHAKIKDTTQIASNYGIHRLAPTIHGKLDQTNKWLINPYFNINNGIGEKAGRFIINECRVLAISQCKDVEDREDFLQKAYETELLLNQLINKLKKENSDPYNHKSLSQQKIDLNAVDLGKQLIEKFKLLSKQIKRCLIQQVADDFIDINHPLKKLAEVGMKRAKNNKLDPDTMRKKYDTAANDFLNHTKKLCKTAQQLASVTNQSRNKQTTELINELTIRIVEFSPQVVSAAFILLQIPNNSSIVEHFELMQSQWQFMMERLQKLVDESLDTELFIRACEHSIIRETYQTQAAVQDQNSVAIITHALNIIRRSNRIVQVASQEADNSEENEYVDQISMANEGLKQCLPVMVNSAKRLAGQSSNKECFLAWTNSNEKLIDAISAVREAVSLENCSDDMSNQSSSYGMYSEDLYDDSNSSSMGSFCQIPEFDLLKINEEKHSDSPRGYKSTYASRPTPLPDLIEENETDFPVPHSNQPILMAAHDLHVNINQWCSNDNDILTVAKRITLLMAKLSELVGGEIGSKKELIATAKKLADESLEITRIAKLLAQNCTDKRIRMNLLQVSERIPTIGTQLKILSTVKATMLDHNASQAQATKEDDEATEMLVGNAQNLNLSVKATVEAAKSATIKIKADSGLRLRWIRRRSR